MLIRYGVLFLPAASSPESPSISCGVDSDNFAFPPVTDNQSNKRAERERKMKFIIYICFIFFIVNAKCGLLGGILGEKLDLSKGNVVNNVMDTLRQQTNGVVEDLGDLLGPKKSDESKTNNQPIEESFEEKTRKDTTTSAATSVSSPAKKQDESKKLFDAQEKPKTEVILAPVTEVNKIEDTTTESSVSTITEDIVTQ